MFKISPLPLIVTDANLGCEPDILEAVRGRELAPLGNQWLFWSVKKRPARKTKNRVICKKDYVASLFTDGRSSK